MLEQAAAPLTGKGLWLENAAEDFAALRAFVRRAALSHLMVRVADGADALNWDVVQELHSRLGLPVWGVVRLYGRAPAFKFVAAPHYQSQQAETALHAAQVLSLSGLVLEAREGWEQPDGEEVASAYVQTLRAGVPHLPLALSAWSYPPAHANFPGREFRAACAVDMPFVFSAAQLGAAHHIFSRLTPQLAFAPVVPAFASQHFSFSNEELTHILNRADELNVPALSVWDWHALQQPSQMTLATVYAGWHAPATAESDTDEAELDNEALMTELHTLLADADEELPEHLRDEALAVVEADEVDDLDSQLHKLLADADEELPGHSRAEAAEMEPEVVDDLHIQLHALLADQDDELPEHLQDEPARWLKQDTETGAVFFSESQRELTSQPVLTHFFKALRTGRLAEATACYAPEFTHINPQHVTRNPADVAQFYSQLFTHYNAATLAVSQMQGSARLIAVSWTLHAPSGEVLHGQDSFHLNRHNQIVYHDLQFQEPLASG
ncbi:MAG: nuclear transport factor 2 family protein [Anaerolineales bacterium]|nr:nuclear transport factor 2 family protein [Anaerolineales bacterium]